MKVFEAPEFNFENTSKFLRSQIRREGFFKKRNLESLEGISVIHRPFRRISWKLETPSGLLKTSCSFIDEEMSSSITDNDHRFLLWRPRYVSLKILESDDSTDDSYKDNTEAIQEVLDEFVVLRSKGQELDEELKPRLRSLQADPLSAIALIVPRTPYGLKREAKILAERKDIHSFVLASSLVSNSSPKDIVISTEIGERVFVKTIMARYIDLVNGSKNLKILETPGSESLRDAQQAGKALTRICELYPEYADLISNSFSL